MLSSIGERLSIPMPTLVGFHILLYGNYKLFAKVPKSPVRGLSISQSIPSTPAWKLCLYFPTLPLGQALNKWDDEQRGGNQIKNMQRQTIGDDTVQCPTPTTLKSFCQMQTNTHHLLSCNGRVGVVIVPELHSKEDWLFNFLMPWDAPSPQHVAAN